MPNSIGAAPEKRPYQAKDLLFGLLTALGLGVAGLLLLPFAVMPVGHLWLAALCMLRVRRGTISAYAGAAFLTLAAFILLGGQLALLVGLVVFGALSVMVLVLDAKRSFTEQLLGGSAGVLLVILLAALLFQRFYGDIVEAVMDFFRQMFTLTPEIEAMFQQSFVQLYGSEFELDKLLYVLEESLRANLPGDVLAYCVYGAGLAVFAARRVAARMGQIELAGKKEDLARWAMPKYSARTLGGAALCCYVLSLTALPQLAPTASALWRLFEALFAIHGACALAYMMRMRGSGALWRTVLIALLLLFLPLVLCLMALFERMTPSVRTQGGKGGKILVVQKRKGEDEPHDVRELDEEELPEFFRELLRGGFKPKEDPGDAAQRKPDAGEKPADKDRLEQNEKEDKKDDSGKSE